MHPKGIWEECRGICCIYVRYMGTKRYLLYTYALYSPKMSWIGNLLVTCVKYELNVSTGFCFIVLNIWSIFLFKTKLLGRTYYKQFMAWITVSSTECDLVTPYGDIDLLRLRLAFLNQISKGRFFCLMARMAPKHCLRQYWLIISEVL